MKVAVIGAGAVGLFVAASLKQQGVEVALYLKNQQEQSLFENEGIHLYKKNQKTIITDIQMNPSNTKDFDGVIVCVKSYQVEQVLLDYKHVGHRHTNWLFLQNGMGHLEWIETMTSPTYVGVVEYGLLKEKEQKNRVSVKGEGRIKIAPFRGTSSAGKAEWGSLFNQDVWTVLWRDDYQEMLESKLILNACINPLTALLHVRNGELVENGHYKQAMRSCFTEIIEALERSDREEKWVEVERLCKDTKENQSSMLTDLIHNRPLELEAIVGYILKRGETRGILMPTLQLVYTMLKGKQKALNKKS
ncbi:2-dehydropantoate 2-reductase [Shouchella lehensis]|uniref:2-dehydropantoate 2-reductase n=2 Tax=Shouchella lehensis TaxID=300825 RepID=A0A4Y7WQ54_9BACI|nr:2-dehydropantoate 2-reductase [Shouchella lehensis]TES50789.1 2-dehydropantoate 2-reductase [Shouchella lehensis]